MTDFIKRGGRRKLHLRNSPSLGEISLGFPLRPSDFFAFLRLCFERKKKQVGKQKKQVTQFYIDANGSQRINASDHGTGEEMGSTKISFPTRYTEQDGFPNSLPFRQLYIYICQSWAY